MNIIIIFPYNKSTLLSIYSFNSTHKVLFIIRIWLVRLHVSVTLHLLHYTMQPLLYMNLSHLLLGKKIGFNLLNDNEFTIPYILDTITNLPSGNQIKTWSKINVWIISINVEGQITEKGAPDELYIYQNQCGELNFNIILCKRKSASANILRNFSLDLIKSYLWFPIFIFVSHKSLWPPKILEILLKVLRANYRKNIYM